MRDRRAGMLLERPSVEQTHHGVVRGRYAVWTFLGDIGAEFERYITVDAPPVSTNEGKTPDAGIEGEDEST